MKTINMEYKYIQYKDNNIQEVKDFLNELRENYLISVQENQDNEVKGVQINFTKMEGKSSRGAFFIPVSGYLVLDAENHLISYREENFKKKFNIEDKKYDFRRKKGKEYYYIGSNNFAIPMGNIAYPSDDRAYEINNYFPSKETAEKFAKIQLLQRKLLMFSLENGMDEIDWEDSSTNKYFIYFNPCSKEYYIDARYCISDINEIYFRDRETAKRALELFKKEIEEVKDIKW